MKPKFFVPFMILFFLAGSAIVSAQDRNEKKINRLQRKIERDTKKLQELTGDQIHEFEVLAPAMHSEEIEKIKEEVRAQTDEAREQVREAMEQQREAMEEQRAALEDQKREMEEQVSVLHEWDPGKIKELKDMQIEIQKNINGKKYHYYYKSPKLEFDSSEPVVIGVPEFKGKAYRVFSDDQDNLSITKNLTDESSSADFIFEAKEGASGLAVDINGSIEAGKVKIVIKRPDGEVYNEYTLSPLANVNWKQNISFEEGSEKEFIGKWTVSVSAEKAKGNYTVRLSGK